MSNIQVLEGSEFKTTFFEVNGQRYQERTNIIANFRVENAPQPALDALDDDDMKLTLRDENYQNVPMPNVEDSFINPPSLPDLPDLENPVEGFFSRNKWWFIGGALVIGAFILTAVYVNARGRTVVSEAI